MKFLLASTSPRRRELFKSIVEDFEIASPHFDEESIKCSNVKNYVKALSKGKAGAVFNKSVGDWCVIGADTVVILNNKVLGKPKNRAQAKDMLKELSGKTHKVLTGVCIMFRIDAIETIINFVDETTVEFINLSEEMINEYISTTEPYDKAGGYAIQGLAGKFVKKINGSFHNVVGFPITRIYEILKQENLI